MTQGSRDGGGEDKEEQEEEDMESNESEKGTFFGLYHNISVLP